MDRVVITLLCSPSTNSLQTVFKEPFVFLIKLVNEKKIDLIWYLFRETGNSHEGKISKL